MANMDNTESWADDWLPAPNLLEPEQVDVEVSVDVFGEFRIPRIWKMGREENYDVQMLESNTAVRMAQAYSATWGLDIEFEPLKPMLEKLYQRVYDDQLSGRGVYSVEETNQLVAQLQKLLGITENDSDGNHA